MVATWEKLGPFKYLIYGVVFAKVIYSRMQKDIYISDSRQRIVSSHLMLAMNLPSMDATLTYKAEALELQRQLRQLQTQYDMLSGQASALIQGRRARVVATSSVLKNTNVRLKDTVNQIPLLDLMESFPFVPAKTRNATGLVALAIVVGLCVLTDTLGTLVPVIGVSGFATTTAEAAIVLGTIVSSFR
ncbi:hypothetical protein CsSME_00051347 [Camellia sinensis var. sinensis]